MHRTPLHAVIFFFSAAEVVPTTKKLSRFQFRLERRSEINAVIFHIEYCYLKIIFAQYIGDKRRKQQQQQKKNNQGVRSFACRSS